MGPFAVWGCLFVWVPLQVPAVDAASSEATILLKQPASVNAVAAAADGRHFAGTSFSTVHIWERDIKKERRSLPLGEGPLLSLAWSPAGELLAAGTQLGSIFLCNTKELSVAARLRGHRNDVLTLAFTPDGKTLFSSGTDGTIRVWDTTTHSELKRLDAVAATVRALAVSPDGSTLATSGPADSIQLRDLPSGRVRQSIPNAKELWGLEFSPSSKLLASAGSQLSVWECASGQRLHTFSTQDGPPLQPGETTYAATFDSSGRTLISGGADGVVRLWDVLTGQQIAFTSHHTTKVYGVAVLPELSALVSASEDGTLRHVELRGKPAGPLGVPRAESVADIERWWTTLAGPDAARAHRAFWDLVGNSTMTVRFLNDRLKPAPIIGAERIPRLIGDLDADRFRLREQATEELARLGELATPALEMKLAAYPSPEAYRRINRLLQTQRSLLEQPEKLQAVRGIGVLEQTRTAEAEALLERLAGGQAEARLTREASQALERIRKRKVGGERAEAAPARRPEK